MNRLSAFCDTPTGAETIRHQLAGIFETRFISLDRMGECKPEQYTVLDVDLRDNSILSDVKGWLKHKPKNAKIIFAVSKGSRLEFARAYAMGATDLVARPVDGKTLLIKLLGDFESLARDAWDLPLEASAGVAAAFGALQDIFSSAFLGAPLDQAGINKAGDAIVSHIETAGLASWIDTVRKHHSQTYQHSLLVTGLAVGFARQLGLSSVDRQRLCFAGLLHDLGKARIPVAILEKPGPLDSDEMGVMKQHPLFGLNALESVPGVHPEMIDTVLHHHEFLDGSGYPHGLQGGQISDLVRILTIADIYGALIERRAYKPPMHTEAAYQTLVDMGPKLDKDLVREFRAVAQLKVA